jgi:hypothetical protein
LLAQVDGYGGKQLGSVQHASASLGERSLDAVADVVGRRGHGAYLDGAGLLRCMRVALSAFRC